MERSPFEQVQTKLAEALALPEHERLPYVRRTCGGDAALCDELETLLALQRPAERFLNTPLPELLGAEIPVRRELASGILIGRRYRIKEPLSASGFATVYLAEDEHILRRPVVVKVLDGVQSDETLRRVFEAEMQSLGRLQHPNVVTLSDRGELEDGTPFLVLGYVPGRTLREVLKAGPVQLWRVRAIVRGVAQALQAAHQIPVWHLDIKPENLILTDEGTPTERVTVIDFGIAQIQRVPGSRVGAGSPRYMAPEQMQAPSARSDVYALALVTFELLTGYLPEAAVPLSGQLPKSMASVAETLQRALAEDPAHRYATAEEFSRALDADGRRDQTKPRVWWPAVATLAVLLACGGLATLLWERTGEAEPNAGPVPLLTDPGFKWRPAFSPDGADLYYAAVTGERAQIFRKPLTGGPVTAVTQGAFKDVFFQVAPEGGRLAIIRETPSGRLVLVKNLGPGHEEIEIDRGREYESLSWSADGESLVVGEGLLNQWKFRIGVLDVRTRRWRTLLEPVAGSLGDHYPLVSPDGRYLAFVREWNGRQTELMRVPIDSGLRLQGPPAAVIEKRNRVHSFQWTPDSRELVFVDGPVAAGSIWRVPAKGGMARPVLPGAAEVESVSLPARAWKLAYSVQNSDINIWRYDLRTKAARPFVVGAYVDNEPHLSPDGKTIAFFSSRSGSEQLWLASTDGSNARQVTNLTVPDAMDAFWSPDSRELVVSVRSASLGMRVYRASAVAPYTLTELLRDGFATSLSRDGRWIYFRSLRSGEWEIWRTDYRNPSRVEQVTTEGAYTAFESADGKSLFFSKRHEREGLWEKPLAGGPGRRLIDRLYRRSLYAPASHGVYYVALAEDGNRQALYYREARTGQVSRIHTFERRVFWGMDLAPDEGSLLYSQYDAGNSNIMLVADFR